MTNKEMDEAIYRMQLAEQQTAKSAQYDALVDPPKRVSSAARGGSAGTWRKKPPKGKTYPLPKIGEKGRAEKALKEAGSTHVAIPEYIIKPSKPWGAPYHPADCDYARMLGLKGHMPVQIAAMLGVSKLTLDQRARLYPEFGEALRDAKTASESYLLAIAQDKAAGRNPLANDAMLRFLLSAGYGMREKTEVLTEHSMGDTHKRTFMDWGDEDESTDSNNITAHCETAQEAQDPEPEAPSA